MYPYNKIFERGSDAQKELNKLINEYIPNSLTDILARYSNGLLFEILLELMQGANNSTLFLRIIFHVHS